MLSLVPEDDPILFQNCEIVIPSREHSDLGLWGEVVKEMFSVMKTNDGCGLAAPQVGLSYRVFVLDVDNIKYTCFNPKITNVSKSMVTDIEGCLSYPGKRIPITRPSKITVEYTTPGGIKRSKKMSGWLARAFQHENDHLNGIVFTEYMNEDS